MRNRIFQVVVGVALLVTSVPAAAQSQRVMSRGGVTLLGVSSSNSMAQQVDFVHAQAMALPRGFEPADQVQALLSAAAAPTGIPGFSAGGYGNGLKQHVALGKPSASVSEGFEAQDFGLEDFESQEFGTSNHPFSTARADLNTAATNTQYPYRASGKLFFNVNGGTSVCSASLIKRGIVVTAAHCVAAFGRRQFYSDWRFVPGYRNGAAPYGVWTAATVRIPTSYFAGTESCYQYGVICPNDVAIIELNQNNGTYPGTSTGWYGYGWNGFGFASNVTHITQNGYPVCLDNGLFMERTDSHGYVYPTFSSNTIIGSLMCGGSSGGPWLVNFGIRPALTGTASGTAANSNVVVGVTSWGYTNSAVKQQGASPFTSNNIVPLVNAACTAAPAACS